jgi:DNA mismatch repair protein MutS2
MPNSHEPAAFAAEFNEDVPTVDLHGLTRDQAVHSLENELHHQFMLRSDVLRVIHGRGSGALRDAVHAYLRKEPLVAYFRDATLPGIQDGVTVVVLHQK